MTIEELRQRYPNKAEWFYAQMIRHHNEARKELARQPATPRPELPLPAPLAPTPPSKRKQTPFTAIFDTPIVPATAEQMQPANYKAFVPVPIESEANSRKHWRAKLLHVKKQREAIGLYLIMLKSCRKYGLPTTVSFERIGANELDRDNLVSAFKAAQDTVADLLDFDDRVKAVTWRHSQTANRKATKGFFLEIRWGGQATCPFCLQLIPETLNGAGGQPTADEATDATDKQKPVVGHVDRVGKAKD